MINSIVALAGALTVRGSAPVDRLAPAVKVTERTIITSFKLMRMETLEPNFQGNGEILIPNNQLKNCSTRSGKAAGRKSFFTCMVGGFHCLPPLPLRNVSGRSYGAKRTLTQFSFAGIASSLAAISGIWVRKKRCFIPRQLFRRNFRSRFTTRPSRRRRSRTNYTAHQYTLSFGKLLQNSDVIFGPNPQLFPGKKKSNPN